VYFKDLYDEQKMKNTYLIQNHNGNLKTAKLLVYKLHNSFKLSFMSALKFTEMHRK